MNRLFIFNPDNDGALAFGRHHYSAPKNAALLRRCGAGLPAWFAEDNDFIACREVDMPTPEIMSLFNLKCRPFNRSECQSISSFAPWGWSAAIVDDFVAMGIEPERLPTDEIINRIRMLSHRRTSIEINRRLHEAGIKTPCPATEVFSVDELGDIISKHGTVFIKSPWSSSGRGVFSTSSLSVDEVKRRSDGIIHRQGSVIVEKQLKKIKDFAMLFHAENGFVRFIGLSLFMNSHMTAYAGNVAAPQSRLREIVSRHLSFNNLDLISSTLETILSAIIADSYNGYLGVDMMVYRDDSGVNTIAPCIELNLRTTMGIVALRLSERYLAAGSEGRMTVEYNNFKEVIKPTVCDGKLISGTIDLTAPNPHFQFRFSAETMV